MGSWLPKATDVPTVTGSTRGTKVLLSWLMLLPRSGDGRGVPPSARLSQTTAPPGPRVPPPLTSPLTFTSGCTGELEGGGGGPAVPAAGATAAGGLGAAGSA